MKQPDDLELRALGPGGNVLDMPAMAPGAPAPATAVDRWLLRAVLHVYEPPFCSFVLWNGEEIKPRGTEPATRLKIDGRAAIFKLLTNPNLHFGDLYSTGSIEVEGNLIRFLEDLYLAIEAGQARRPYLFSGIWRDHTARAGTPARSRDNIQHHYGLDNAFYQLWLDGEAMQYTCAYFPDPAMSLEAAQIAKMHHVCRKLFLTPGETVVEAGCGWGGLALFMARHYGVTVRAYNISREQVAFARERLADAGLGDRVKYIEDDYRSIRGTYDAFVSIGMLEHVGPDQYRALGAVVDRCLKDTGRGLVQNIGRNRPGRMNAWIEKRIFPGAYPPTLREMMEIFEPFSFPILDVENLRLHYARTLEHWLARYEAQADTIRERYGETFLRAWRLYLSGAIASFTTGWLQLFQVTFSRPRRNALPWSRGLLYQDTARGLQVNMGLSRPCSPGPKE